MAGQLTVDENGQLVWDDGLGQMAADAPVPGAQYGVPPVAGMEIADRRDQEMAKTLEGENKQLEAQKSEQQKIAEKQAADQVAAKKANIDAQKAQLIADEANAKAGNPELVESLTPGSDGQRSMALIERAPISEGEAVSAAAEVTGQPLSELDQAINKRMQPYADALESQGEAGAMQIGVDARRADLTTKADLTDAIMLEEEGRRRQRAIDDARKETRAGIEKIDAELTQFMESKVKRPSASVANLLGAFLGGLLIPTTGKNPALALINKRLDQELQVRHENRRSLIQGARQRRLNLVEADRMRERDRAAMDLAKAAELKGVSQALRARIDNQMVHPEAMAKAKQLAADLELQSAKLYDGVRDKVTADFLNQQKLALQAENAETRRLAAAAKGRRGPRGGSKKLKTESQIFDAMAELGVPKEDRSRVALVPVTIKATGERQEILLAPNKATADDFNDKAFAKARFTNDIVELAKLVKQGRGLGTKFWTTEQGARVQTYYTDVLMNLKEDLNLGVLNGADATYLKQEAGKDSTDILNLTPDNILVNLEEMYNITTTDMEERVRRLSANKAKYEYESWEALTRAPGVDARGATGAERAMQAEALAGRAGTGEFTDEQVREAVQEIVDPFLEQGINRSNYKHAKKALENLTDKEFGLPESQVASPLEGDLGNRIKQLRADIAEYEASKPSQKRELAKIKQREKTQKRERAGTRIKSLKEKLDEKTGRKKALEEANRKLRNRRKK